MAKRRPLHGKPLLVASAGAAVAVSLGCGGGGGPDTMVVGNLVAPPMVAGEVCVDVTPEGATVTLDAVPTTERCTTIETWGSVDVEVSAEGYVTQSVHRPVDGTLDLAITLEPVAEPDPTTRPDPRPPQEWPVGNLMPPPRLDPPVKK